MNFRKAIIGGSLVASTMLGGAIGASLINGTASAATTATTTPAATAAAPDNATKAQAAAVKSVGSGTAGDVTSDFTGGGYEVTVTKADGTKVEVHLDSNFSVRMGPPGGRFGGPPPAAPSGTFN